ncbi:MAG: hypothetical protein V7754_00240 [Halioglobus sp.]
MRSISTIVVRGFRCGLAAVSVLTASFILAASAGAEIAQLVFPGEQANLCADAQVLIAQTDVVPRNNLHQSYEDFVESKAATFPLETQQFYSNPEPGDANRYRVVSCKMRTAGSIAAAYTAAGQTVVTGEDRSCDFLAQRMLNQIGENIDSAKALIKAATVVVDEEELTFMGPMWLDPWPFQSAYLDDTGVLHLKSRALYVPWSIFIPAPAAFKGVYYCHLPAPEYVEALLLGRTEAPLEL